MRQIVNEISNAIQILGLGDHDIRLLDHDHGKKVHDEVLNHFVKSASRRWWWEVFKQESFLFKEHNAPFELLDKIIPESCGKVWLIVEDDGEDFYPVYEANPGVIGAVLGECFCFEYYVIDKEKKWLICENHHNRLIGIGEELRSMNIERIHS